MTAPSVPAPIPAPEHFPVTWHEPGAESLFWVQDLMHFPTPITPFTDSLQGPAFSIGASRGIEPLSMPIIGLKTMVQNSYVYIASVPFEGTPEEMEARLETMKGTIMGIMQTLLPRFWDEYVPRIVALADGMRYGDYSELSVTELAGRVHGLLDIYTELWDIHMQVNIPPMAAVFGLEEFITATLGEEAAAKSHLMLQGFANKSIETGQRLWEIAKEVRTNPALAKAIKGSHSEASFTSAIETVPGGGDFLESWRAFLAEYGWRTGGFEVSEPSWIEVWTVPVNQLNAFVSAENPESPLQAQARQAAERDRMVAEYEGKLPVEAQPIFRMLLAAAQAYIPLAEDHNFYIDQMAFNSGRVPALALGRAMVSEGMVDVPADVFFLTMDDIATIAAGDTSARTAVVAERRAALEAAKGSIPPEALGTRLPPDMPADPVMTKFFGFGTDLPSDTRVIRGIASSAGTATGTVKVVRTLAEADKIEPGDVLVCHMTMPAWTPLFSSVAAVVADSGGVLSHCSIVAREYGIPCVSATRVGTRLLKDGQTVTVDGGRGIVRVI